MPLPKSASVEKIMHKLKEEDMPHRQKVAIALSQARKYGADIPKKEDQEHKKMMAMHKRQKMMA